MDILYLQLKNQVMHFDGKIIGLPWLLSLAEQAEGFGDDQRLYLQSPQGQAVLKTAIERLVLEQILLPVGKKPQTPQGLYLKYRIHRNQESKDRTLTTEIIQVITPPAALDYYLKNPEDYSRDKCMIEIICNFISVQKLLQQNVVTVNERAYQLFGDEKFFKGAGQTRSRGETVLKRLGLTYASLACEETVEPFFSFQKKDFYEDKVLNQLNSKRDRHIFIIENKDTFWSFKRYIMDRPSRIKVDMLIYGEGKKILSSLQFVEEFAVNPKRDQLFYFGDLDAEGINIYCELCQAYPQYQIVPFAEGYQVVAEIGWQREPVKTPKEQRFNKANLDKFSSDLSIASADGGQALDQGWILKLKEMLEGGYYIPQEALAANEMKERFGKNEYVGF